MKKPSRYCLSRICSLLIVISIFFCNTSLAAPFSSDPDAIEEAVQSVLMLEIIDGCYGYAEMASNCYFKWQWLLK